MIPLKQIALDCIADMRQKLLYPDTYSVLSKEELLAYAEGRGYQVNPNELFNAADNIYIDNLFGEFRINVVKPIERVQGIYF